MFVIIDLETTGGVFNKEKIIEIGLIKYDGSRVLETFQSLINPFVKIDPFIERLTGIKNKQLYKSKSFKSYSKKIYDFLKDSIIVGHDVKYDLRVLTNEFKKEKIFIKNKSLCTLEMMKEKYSNLSSYKLKSLSKEFNIDLFNHHRAMDDAKATLELLKLCNE
jgi:DNA polymerase-3 subunit epsilon|tara:strand:+ start:190 stop:678 length:489 start_codon:yes stop_codon:yes gene_type:complete